jgi:hypothetical protein
MATVSASLSLRPVAAPAAAARRGAAALPRAFAAGGANPRGLAAPAPLPRRLAAGRAAGGWQRGRRNCAPAARGLRWGRLRPHSTLSRSLAEASLARAVRARPATRAQCP